MWEESNGKNVLQKNPSACFGEHSIHLKLFYDGLHPDAAWASKAQMSHAEMNATVPSDGLFLSDFTVWQEITNI